MAQYIWQFNTKKWKVMRTQTSVLHRLTQTEVHNWYCLVINVLNLIKEDAEMLYHVIKHFLAIWWMMLHTHSLSLGKKNNDYNRYVIYCLLLICCYVSLLSFYDLIINSHLFVIVLQPCGHFFSPPGYIMSQSQIFASCQCSVLQLILDLCGYHLFFASVIT